MIEVQAPNGSIIEFPDGTPPEKIKQVMRSQSPQDKFGPQGSALRNINAAVEGFNYGVESRGRGIAQAGLEALASIGLPTEELAQGFGDRERAARQGLEQAFPDSGYAKGGAFTGQLLSLAPAAPLMPQTAIAGGAVGGGLESLTSPVEKGGAYERAKRTAGGAATGAAGGKVIDTALQPAVKGVGSLMRKIKGRVSDIFSDLGEHGIDETSAFREVSRVLNKEQKRQLRNIGTKYARAKNLGEGATVNPEDVLSLADQAAAQAKEAIIPDEKQALSNIADNLRSLAEKGQITVNNLETIRSGASKASSKGIYGAGSMARQIDDFIIDNVDDPKVGAAWKSAINSRRRFAEKFENPVEIAASLQNESIEAIENRFLGKGPINPKAGRIYSDVLKALPDSEKEKAGFLLRQSVINKMVKNAADKVDDPEGMSASFLANRIRDMRRNNQTLWSKFPSEEKGMLNQLEKDLRKSLKGGPVNRVGDFMFKFMSRATKSNLEAPRTIKPKTVFQLEDVLNMARQKPIVSIGPESGAAASEFLKPKEQE